MYVFVSISEYVQEQLHLMHPVCLFVAIVFVSDVCAMTPQINLIDCCDSNHCFALRNKGRVP